MIVVAPLACALVSPNHLRAPTGNDVFRTGGGVALTQNDARLAGIATAAEMLAGGDPGTTAATATNARLKMTILVTRCSPSD